MKWFYFWVTLYVSASLICFGHAATAPIPSKAKDADTFLAFMLPPMYLSIKIWEYIREQEKED